MTASKSLHPQRRPSRLRSQLWALSGVILFLFVCMHVSNHIMLLGSVNFADSVRPYFIGLWKTWPGSILLYGALILHPLMSLWSLFWRNSLSMKPTEMAQVVFGLMVPYLMAEHIVSAGLGRILFHWTVTYAEVLRSLWGGNPALGIQQALGLTIVWVHGCLGMRRLAASRKWSRWQAMTAWTVALVALVMALSGFMSIGRAYAEFSTRIPNVVHSVQTIVKSPEQTQLLDMITTAIRGGYILLVGGTLILRQIRLFLRNATGIDINYNTGARIQVPRGTSVLEASQRNGIAQYAVCGGHGRCSTCRVRVLSTDGPLPPPNAVEAATLRRIKAPADVRLACQLQPTHTLSIERILIPTMQAGQPHQHDVMPEERAIAVLFCDLRGFTTYSEKQLPYDVVFLLNRYFGVIGEAVAASGGRLDKFLGDGAMALFGLEDDFDTACRNALRAAALIRTQIAVLNEDLRKELGMQLNAVVGVHAGPAIVGRMGIPGADALTAVGDTVNVASRLEAIAKDENVPIVVSDVVIDHAGIAADDIPNHESSIRGRRAALRIYLIDDVAAARFL